MARARSSWLLVALSTAGAPASTRVTAWRKLRSLGSLYLQQSVCMLPGRPETRAAVQALAARVRAEGGTARILEVSVTDPAEQDTLVAELQAARDAEYEEVLARFGAFFAELETETARGRTTYEELEESEADLDRFRAWITKIDARDYFAAPRGQAARDELARAEAALAQFATATMDAEDVQQRPSDVPAAPGSPSRRARRDSHLEPVQPPSA
ncbi:Chromate resistance protein ChrB [Pedococcus sp. NPDC057267]|uniref:Chromate resistance protein ChrB n=1 Tax=Pedococcus sp. NPDC057267 TaxID=3346077 RepID=UPI00362768D0